ncbi:MAG: helix-hairpin-helix domain-containing protein [Gammaproteobacteria bacterium]|jgi:DNA polymerase (family 10)|nr:helix-hairpin-helix domain-containing protein [Gammaproteobacteria bacterium]
MKQPIVDRSFNNNVARILRNCADQLHQQGANPFRVNAYVRAAETLESEANDVREILSDKGHEGLMELPFIGRGLASSIAQIIRTGRLAQLDRLRGEADPEQLFQTVPGIGPKLATAIHDDLHVDTLEALEIAANDGRLATVHGIGPRRAAAIRSNLAALVGRARGSGHVAKKSPPIGMLLDVDREYRQKTEAGKLPKIAPRRFNPEAKAWLPVLHTDRQDWQFTALFSNTARAHELHRTDDWVVLYFHDGDHSEGQVTVVTETHGPLQGQRVVRGREADCRKLLLGHQS